MLKLAGVVLVVAGLALLAYWIGLKEFFQWVILWLREVGPLAFFSAMALLPAFGFPLLPFTVAAGPVFGPILGPGWVVFFSILALVFNLSLSYWLAGLLRPLALRMVNYLGYPLPESGKDIAWQVVTVVRLTPGPPYCVQSYLLGLLRVAFIPYLVMSTLVVSGFIVGLVYGGDALSRGHGRNAFIALGFLGALAAGIHLLRKGKRRIRDNPP